MLSEVAKEMHCYVIGGSIPERDSGKLYNTSTSFGPDGAMIAKHRKVHLFDIDVPGKIRFQESEVLSPGNQLTMIEIGKSKHLLRLISLVAYIASTQNGRELVCKLYILNLIFIAFVSVQLFYIHFVKIILLFC